MPPKVGTAGGSKAAASSSSKSKSASDPVDSAPSSSSSSTTTAADDNDSIPSPPVLKAATVDVSRVTQSTAHLVSNSSSKTNVSSAVSSEQAATSSAAPTSSTTAVACDGSAERKLLSYEIFIIFIIFALAAYEAGRIRMYAITTYGRIIHEFDPWFNYRATEYLYNNGVSKFFKWFDHESWYPLGRPVGTTIYPGMQFTSVFIMYALSFLDKIYSWRTAVTAFLKIDGFKLVKELTKNGLAMSLNDICVFVPVWFGSIATIGTGLLAREVSGSWMAGACAAAVMSCIPAHLMRSIGGGYDNESIALAAMVFTFYLWCRSLRTPSSGLVWGCLAGLAYGYMVAAWGGFIIVGNMVAIHAATVVLLGYYSENLHKAFSAFFIVGTSIAVNIPVVGWSPFSSLEQISLLAVFLGLQGIFVIEWIATKKLKWSWDANPYKMLGFRIGMCLLAAAAAGAVAYFVLMPMKYFGDLSIRVKSLFIKHTKTGNPLVDSVAEHQPATDQAYTTYLQDMYYVAPVGFGLITLYNLHRFFYNRESYGVQVTKWFIILYTSISYYFSIKMSRLILLLGPVASILSGIAFGFFLEWCFAEFSAVVLKINRFFFSSSTSKASKATPAAADSENVAPVVWWTKPKKAIEFVIGWFLWVWKLFIFRLVRLALICVVLQQAFPRLVAFWDYSDHHAQQISQPSLMYYARLRDGKQILINDYKDSYDWLRENTPSDARVLAWWDYGYQISGIANRTTIADGNTWNIEHIALLGKILTAPEAKAHRFARHLTDYVLIWGGNQGDDLAKSPHMVRIANSQFPEVCKGGKKCENLAVYQTQSGIQPTPEMAKSMLYKMHSHLVTEGVEVNSKLFRLVYTSKYGLVRIFKLLNISSESKQWHANPANRLCDAPGSWYCPGQYSPGLREELRKEKEENAKYYISKDAKDVKDTKEAKETKDTKKKTVETEAPKSSASSKSKKVDQDIEEEEEDSEEDEATLAQVKKERKKRMEERRKKREAELRGEL